MSKELSNLECRVDLVQASDLPWAFDASRYDGVIIGASVHLSRFPAEFRKSVRNNIFELKKIPGAFFFSVFGSFGEGLSSYPGC
jgi:menaquinone-dependent protoporphyrinogen IX oxidase